MMNNFTKLMVWEKAHELTLAVYKTTKNFPPQEQYNLVSQLRRSTASIPTNIVEGNSRNYKKEFVQFLSVARGSLEESKYHLLLSRDLDYLTDKEYEYLSEKADEVGKMLNGLVKSLKAKIR